VKYVEKKLLYKLAFERFAWVQQWHFIQYDGLEGALKQLRDDGLIEGRMVEGHQIWRITSKGLKERYAK
jgi:hypothetical protein